MAEKPPTELYRLTESQLIALKAQIGAATISINSNTTPLQAGTMLGVQLVFNALREGFVVQTPTPRRD